MTSIITITVIVMRGRCHVHVESYALGTKSEAIRSAAWDPTPISKVVQKKKKTISPTEHKKGSNYLN